MTCEEITDFLFAYCNGELTETQRSVFDEHLGECPNCVAYLQSYEMTIRLSKTVRDEGIHHECVDGPDELVRAILDARKRSV